MSAEYHHIQGTSNSLIQKETIQNGWKKVYIISFFLGIASLFGKHLIDASGIYFKIIYPSHYSNYFMLRPILIYCGFDLLTLLLIIKYSNYTSFFCRIMFGCAISLATLLTLPISMNAIFERNIDLSLNLIMILYGINGISGAIITVSKIFDSHCSVRTVHCRCDRVWPQSNVQKK